jgi:hypothetical protein
MPLFLLALMAAYAADENTLTAAEKKPIGVLLITPTGNVASTSSSELIRIVGGLLDAHTDLVPALIDPVSVASCRGRIACFATSSSVDTAGARHLLVLSNFTGKNAPDRLSVLLIDVEAAKRIIADMPREAEDDLELDARLGDGAVLARPKWVVLANADETRAYLRKVFEEELKQSFEATGHWEPYGTIALELEEPGFAIELDGRALGVTKAAPAKIAGVLPGKRTLRLTHPSYEHEPTEVLVERGALLSLTPDLKIKAGPSATVRSAIFWSGLALAAGGTALTAIAVTGGNSSSELLCVSASGGDCMDRRSFARSDQPGGAPAFGENARPGGFLFGPAGYSLVAAGGMMALLALIFEEEDRFPWIELAAGVAAGVLSYGLSAAFDEGTGF